MELEKIKNCTKLEISNQGFIKNGWKLLDAYKDETTNRYYGLVECIYCKRQQVVNYYNFVREDKNIRACKECKWLLWGNSMIGQIINNNEILSVDKIEYSSNKTARVYFKVKCTKCGHEHVKLYNPTQWNITEGCAYCNKKFDDSFINDVYKRYVDGARQRNLSWEISPDLFLKLINSKCRYCGAEPQFRERHLWNTTKSGYYTGIDRVDSSLGYTEQNVVPCCSTCNMMKNKLSVNDFKNHIEHIYNHFIKQGSTAIESTSENDGSE